MRAKIQYSPLTSLQPLACWNLSPFTRYPTWYLINLDLCRLHFPDFCFQWLLAEFGQREILAGSGGISESTCFTTGPSWLRSPVGSRLLGQILGWANTFLLGLSSLAGVKDSCCCTPQVLFHRSLLVLDSSIVYVIDSLINYIFFKYSK